RAQADSAPTAFPVACAARTPPREDLTMLEQYLERLSTDSLAVSPAALIAAWALLLVLAHLGYRAARAAMARQVLVQRDEVPLDRAREWRMQVLRILLAGAVIGTSLALGPQAFAFLGGGYVLMTAFACVTNLRGLLYLRAQSRPGAAQGSVRQSAALGWK